MTTTPPTPRKASTQAAEFDVLFDREFNTLATHLLSPLIDLLITARRHFEGDVDKLLLMLVVGVRTAADPKFLCLSESDRSAGETILPGLGTNVRSMAASLGMPRESVRRKVIELLDVGWVAWHDRKLHLTARAYRELAPIRDAMKRLALTNFQTLSALAAAAPGNEA